MAVATGFPALDLALPGGGWPWGAVIEVFAERQGIGELAVWMPALASLSRREDAQSRWIVFVAPPLIPYAPALVRCGVGLERLLWVDASETGNDGPWAAEQAVRSGASAAVLAWLRSLDDTALRRFQLAAEEQGCAVVLFRPLAALRSRSPAAMRMRLSRVGARTRVEILKCRGGRPLRVDLDLAGVSG